MSPGGAPIRILDRLKARAELVGQEGIERVALVGPREGIELAIEPSSELVAHRPTGRCS